MVRCALGCKESLPRRDMEAHVAGPCAMRPAECPFRALGCLAPGLVQGEVASHLEEARDAHLQLAMARLLQQDRELSAMRQAMAEMKAAAETTAATSASAAASTIAGLQKKIAALEAGQAAAQAASKKSVAQAKDTTAALATRLAKLERERG